MMSKASKAVFINTQNKGMFWCTKEESQPQPIVERKKEKKKTMTRIGGTTEKTNNTDTRRAKRDGKTRDTKIE